jgi:hypothetical protein
MAPESEARPRAFYDHENAEPRRQRRAAADWGVNEDIFDRMPSRFARIERRGGSQEIVLRRDENEVGVAVIAGDEFARDAAGGRFERTEAEAWARGDAPVRVQPVARVRTEREPGQALELDPRAAARAKMSWGDDLDDDRAPMVAGETRTIVLSRAATPPQLDELYADESPLRDTGEFAALAEEAQERRTIKISGHPDRLPVPRTQRGPRTAVERIGHRPDRIAAYAVALGFLLVLIAVLTTGQ